MVLPPTQRSCVGISGIGPIGHRIRELLARYANEELTHEMVMKRMGCTTSCVFVWITLDMQRPPLTDTVNRKNLRQRL